MKPQTAALMLSFLLATPASAALPPVYDRISQITAAAQAAQDVLGQRYVESVRYIDGLQYDVASGACTVRVELLASHPDYPGPAVYTGTVIDTENCE